MLDANKELYEAIEELLHLVDNKEEDVVFAVSTEFYKESYIMHCKDQVANQIVNEMTLYAAKLFIWELRQEVSEEELLHYDATNTSCDCVQWCSYHLPCRHMIQIRRQNGT